VTALDNLRKEAKRWLRSLRAGDPDARARLARAYPSAPATVTLRVVQHALARERGYDSWVALTRGLHARTAPDLLLADFLAAAAQDDVARASALLDEHPALINQRGTLPGHTGLRTALHFGSRHESMVRLLLERGADPNIRDEGDNACPLHFAAERGDLPIVKLLIAHGADPIGADTTHELDVLGWAVCFENATRVDVARYLLAHGASLTLFPAVALGEADAVRMLARSGVDINQRMDRTNHRRAALHLAVVKRQPAALAALIDAGADLDAQDAVGLTPLDQAALNGEEQMVRMLVDAGATITLPAAIALGRDDIVQQLVREDPELMSTTDNRRWARLVVHASRRASAAVMERLLRTVMQHRAGLSIVNMEDDEETAVDGVRGYTALHEAAFHGNNEAVSVLLQHGANPRARDQKYCSTPAGWAAYAGHHETANLLLEADIDIFDAISFDRADRVAAILDRDPAAIDRPFSAYASCSERSGGSWPSPGCTPLEWATAQEKTNAARVLIERGADRRTPGRRRRNTAVASFLQFACWDHEVHGRHAHRRHDRAAGRLLAHEPAIAHENLYTALVCGELQAVRRILAAQPELARQRGGSRGWTPILYLAYTRFTHAATIEHALPIARLLLDLGADPNDFYMACDARYSVLTGIAGEGEQDAPRQPYARELFDLLLQRGAEPFDIQVLYNTHFSGDMLWWLQLVHAHTIGTTRGAAWDDPEWSMFDMGAYGTGARFVLERAIKTRNVDLARWALEHGANPDAAPARDKRFPKCSLYELSLVEDVPEIGELLVQHGARRTTPSLNDHDAFLRACWTLDRQAARRLLTAHPEYIRSSSAVFDAARRNRPDVLALLLELGFPLEWQDATGKRALHEAAASNAVRAAQFLIEQGAEIDPRESTYGGTPLGWSAYGDRREMLDVLSRHSRDIAVLCACGYVDRVRHLVTTDPSLARIVDGGGNTLLWWLPDEAPSALELVEVLVRAGVDPNARNQAGMTAADRARQRGLLQVAAALERLNEPGARP
jgi:ankyrin repeat protein